jgi:phage FluMu gp28-like protein
MPTPEELAADATVEAYEATPGLTVLVVKYAELKAQLDAMETNRKEVQAEFDKLRKEYLPHALTDYGVTCARTPLGTVSVRTKTHASVPANRRDECREWCLAKGLGAFLTLEPTNAVSIAQDLIEHGQPVPDFIRLFNEEVAVLTRKKE